MFYFFKGFGPWGNNTNRSTNNVTCDQFRVAEVEQNSAAAANDRNKMAREAAAVTSSFTPLKPKETSAATATPLKATTSFGGNFEGGCFATTPRLSSTNNSSLITPNKSNRYLRIVFDCFEC